MERQTKHKALKVGALVLALVLLAGLGLFANSLLGNPISKHLARRAALEYLDTRYSAQGYVLDEVFYNFKTADYCARIVKPDSPDRHFELLITPGGTVRYDSFENEVASAWNTWYRLETEYRDLTDTVLGSPELPFTLTTDYGSLPLDDAPESTPWDEPPRIKLDELEIDGQYDLRELGHTYGRLVITAEDEDVSTQRAAEILLELRRRMDEAGVPFAAVEFCLEPPRPLDSDAPRRPESVNLLCIRYEELVPEGLVQRVEELHQATLDHYARLDAEMAQEVPQAIDTAD